MRRCCRSAAAGRLSKRLRPARPFINARQAAELGRERMHGGGHPSCRTGRPVTRRLVQATASYERADRSEPRKRTIAGRRVERANTARQDRLMLAT